MDSTEIVAGSGSRQENVGSTLGTTRNGNRRTNYSVSSITPQTQQWTSLVQVVERHRPQISNPPGKKYRRHVVTDQQGIRVSVVVYEPDIWYFGRYLIPFRRYNISNATLRPARGSFKVSSYDYIWVLNKRVLVEPIHEEIPPVLPCAFDITTFDNVFKYAEKQAPLNLKAMVVGSLGEREITDATSVTDLILINEAKIPMIFTLWTDVQDEEPVQLLHHLHDRPVIIALSVKATTFFGMSVSSKMATYILINPPLPEGDLLQTWYDENRADVTQLIADKAYNSSDLLLPQPSAEHIIPLATAISSIQVEKTMWVAGTLKLIRGKPGYWFAACSNCHKTMNADIGWMVECPCCKQTSEVEPRCRIAVYIKDETARVQALLFSTDAEKFVPFTATEFRDAEMTGHPTEVELRQMLDGQRIVCFLKYFETKLKGEVNQRYTIIKAYPQDTAPYTSDNFNDDSDDPDDVGTSGKHTTKSALRSRDAEQHVACITEVTRKGPLTESGKKEVQLSRLRYEHWTYSKNRRRKGLRSWYTEPSCNQLNSRQEGQN